MKKQNRYQFIGISIWLMMSWACQIPKLTIKQADKTLPVKFGNYPTQNQANFAEVNWRNYFADTFLIALIDSALLHNQELHIITQEMAIYKNEIRARKGEYLPFVGLGATSGIEKPGRFTRFGALEEQLEVAPGKVFPAPLQDYLLGANATWELDIWKKLRNAKKAATLRYLGSVEGKNFLATQLIAEISEAYYELMALDNMQLMLAQNIALQANALNVVKQQKESAKVSQLAVNRFEAQLLNTQNLQFAIKQRIVETENKINYLCGRYPQPVQRNASLFFELGIDTAWTGSPSDLLSNRPDVKQASYTLEASNLDIKVAKANFYPSLSLRAGVGLQAFNPSFLVQPESMLYNLTGDLIAPLINRNAIKAAYNSANAKQIQAVYKYQQTLLNAYVEVINQLAKAENYQQSFTTKNKQVELLYQSINIANNLFYAARADYAEVLLTQREALESKMELIEIKLNQLQAKINLYRSLGGGWQ
jgi:outer membrane protein, multidrug efflux system